MSKLYKGIDVSHHQGKIDWRQVKAASIDFAILRCGYIKSKETVDSQFENNYAGASSINIPLGIFFYSYALTEAAARKEAEFCYKLIKDKKIALPVFYDMEEKAQLNLGKQKVLTLFNIFKSYLTSKGVKVGIYSFDTAFANIFDASIQNNNPVWVATVDRKPYYCKKYSVWQYSWKGKIAGINTDVDLDYCYDESYFTTSTSSIATKKNTYEDYIPNNIKFYKDRSKNVISTYSLSKYSNLKLSDHFQVKEFASKNAVKTWSDDVKVHNKLIEILEALYNKLDCSKIIVNSGYRTKEHDKYVGGNGAGQHTLGRAADITCYDKKGKIIPAQYVCIALEDMGNVYGIGYITPTSTHVDTRSKDKKWWGDETKSGAPNISRLGYNSFHDYFKI